MKTIAFVTPWFGEKIGGGAEMELRGLVTHLHEAGHAVEILTTCVESFNSDWNKNYHRPGMFTECGVTVRRFPVRKRDTARFDQVNYKLMQNQAITADEETIYVQEMINSPELYQYIEKYQNEYSLFVFIPYMFGTTYYGMQICPQKSVLIPCLHDESYAYLERFKKLFSQIAGMIFHAKPEQELANSIYDLSHVKTAVLGEGVYTDITSDPIRFRRKFKIEEPFILYAGRKDKGKNVDTLIQYFRECKKRNDNDLKLVLIGGGNIDIPADIATDVRDLGFVETQDKYDAYGAASILCQPSTNESFSLVIMEAWLCGTPVLVHGQCLVTKNFVIESNGGLYFEDYFEWEGAVNYLIKRTDVYDIMRKSGREYVLHNFSWDNIVIKYMNFFSKIALPVR